VPDQRVGVGARLSCRIAPRHHRVTQGMEAQLVVRVRHASPRHQPREHRPKRRTARSLASVNSAIRSAAGSAGGSAFSATVANRRCPAPRLPVRPLSGVGGTTGPHPHTPPPNAPWKIAELVHSVFPATSPRPQARTPLPAPHPWHLPPLAPDLRGACVGWVQGRKMCFDC